MCNNYIINNGFVNGTQEIETERERNADFDVVRIGISIVLLFVISLRN